MMQSIDLTNVYSAIMTYYMNECIMNISSRSDGVSSHFLFSLNLFYFFFYFEEKIKETKIAETIETKSSQ